MMLAKLIATLAISIAPAAMRSTAVSAAAPRCRFWIIQVWPRSVLRSGRTHFQQHVVHGWLPLGGVVGHGVKQRLHLGEIVGRKRMHGAAQASPVLLQLLGEVDLPLLRLVLQRH